jgi:hypothetical protein
MLEAVETAFVCVCVQNFIEWLHCHLSCVEVNVGQLKTETDIQILQAVRHKSWVVIAQTA